MALEEASDLRPREQYVRLSFTPLQMVYCLLQSLV